jgi:hypothetical protein
VIHNNFVVGSSNKRERFMNISLWVVDENFRCRQFPQFLPPAPGGKLSVTIKVLAMDRPQALLRLLKSLKEADYLGHTVPLEIFIDQPPAGADPSVIAERRKAVTVARKFDWRHGPLRVVERTSNFGLANMWLNAWFPTSPTETCVILEDDNVVSPHFFSWLAAAAQHYFHNPAQYDPRLFGIMVQNQHMIPGKYPVKPADLLPPDTYFYRYQTLSTWGPLFFPHHWASFLTWFSERCPLFFC